MLGGGLVAYPPAPVVPLSPSGRLTLTSGVPVLTNGSTTSSTVYYTPYLGDVFFLYNGSVWSQVSFSEQSIGLTQSQSGTTSTISTTITGLTNTAQLMRGMQVTGTGIASNTTISTIPSATTITVNNTPSGAGTNTLTFKVPPSSNIDVMGISSSGALALAFSNIWSSATARVDAISLQNGIYVNTSAINSADSNTIGATKGIYLGTVRTGSTTGQANDNVGRMGVWSYFNRVERSFSIQESSTSWTYATASFRQTNANTANVVNILIGVSEDQVMAQAIHLANGNAIVATGIGIDSTSTNSALVVGGINPGTTTFTTPVATYTGYPGVGFHAINWLEYGGSGAMFASNYPSTPWQTGLTVACRG